MITQKKSENLIYLFLWLVVLIVPVGTFQRDGEIQWNGVFFEWIRLIPFLAIFLINNSILAPRFLLRKKMWTYLLYILLATFLITYLSSFLDVFQHFFEQAPPSQGNPPPNINAPRRPPRPNLMINRVIFSLLVVGFNDGIKLLVQRQKEDQQRKEQEKIHLQTELSFLRQQISPHFFMNTLNNIHALIEIEKEQAQEAVIKLSKLMRYLLTESQHGTATIREEFGFLKAYIDLMKLRVSEKVKIDVNLEVEEPDRQIPALLFISSVENAFKHGISYSQASFISINAEIINDKLYFTVKNSKAAGQPKVSGTGVGLNNLRKQLQLLYGTNYVLDIHDGETEFAVNLEIPLEGREQMSKKN